MLCFRGRHTRYGTFILAVLLIAVSFVSCKKWESSEKKGNKIDTTIHRAVSWIYSYPSTFAAGGFIEISEEIITFYFLSKNTEDASQKKAYINQIEKRLQLIKSKKDFKVTPPEYTMLLALAEISKKIGLKVIDFKKIIEEDMLTSQALFPPHITTQVWNSVFLSRLGYTPAKGIEVILPQSTLSQELSQKLVYQHTGSPVNEMYIDPIAITIYDMTHEIFALTDFGDAPPPALIAENQTFFSELFNRTIEWAINVGHIDVLAELIMCVEILNLKNVPSLKPGIDFIISHQKQDGTFGVTNPSRPNVFRHGLLVSVMALSMVKAP